MRRRDLLGCATAITALPLRTVAAQQAMPVIGWLSPARSAQPEVQREVIAFREGLAEAGFVEGRNVRLEYSWAEGDDKRLPALAVALVSRKVDVIVTQGGDLAAAAAKHATSTILIVFNSSDPVAAGLIASLARPGGNLTGIAMMTAELDPKLLELLLELVPRTETVALLANPHSSATKHVVALIEEAARANAIQLRVLNAATVGDFDAAFVELDRLRPGGLIVDIAFARHIVAPLTLRHRVPAIAMWRDFPDSGGLASYGPSLAAIYRLKGAYAGRILKGQKPADLPVQQPTVFELIINLKTAKALGLTIPTSILARADEVIE